jgi:hypothetical protein
MKTLEHVEAHIGNVGTCLKIPMGTTTKIPTSYKLWDIVL